MNFGRAALAILVAACLAGCGAKPRAELALIQQPSDLNGREIDTYAFPRTYIDLVPAENGKGVNAVQRQVSYENFRIAIRPKSSTGVRTRVSLSKKSNSDMLDKAGVEVIDDRAKLVGEVAGIVKGIIKLGAGGRAGILASEPLAGLDRLPITLDTLGMLENPPDLPPANRDEPKTWLLHEKLVRYWFGPLAPDAQPVAGGGFVNRIDGLPYAACRELRLVTTLGTNNIPVTIRHNLFVSDPRYYRFAAFPAKGSIQIHDHCGASVTSEASAAGSDTAVLLSVINQLNDIKTKLDEIDRR